MELARKNGTIYEFDDFRLIPGEGLLLRNGEAVPLGPKPFGVLALLVERHGHLVEKSEIMDLIWEDSFVEEGSLAKSIWFIRQALGDTSKEKFIQTVPRRGYRFVFPVSVMTDGSGAFRISDLVATPGTGNGEVSVIGEQPPNSNGIESASLKTSGKFRNQRRVSVRAVAAVITMAVLAGSALYLAVGGRNLLSRGSTSHIAVMPSRPLDLQRRDMFYDIGIADALIVKLSAEKRMSVRGLNSVRRYEDVDADPMNVASEQNVDYVLSSHYQLAGGKIKVTAALFEVSSGNVVDNYATTTASAEPFVAQEVIANDIGNRLLARFGAPTTVFRPKRGTDNEEAYRLYHHAMNLVDKRSPENSTKAGEYLEQAVALDPNYAQAWAGIALAARSAGGKNNAEIHRIMIEAANRALAIDPGLSDAYSALCYDKLHYAYDFAAAEAACKQAVQLDPDSSTAHRSYSWVLRYSGRYDEALAEIKMAIDLEPVSLVKQRDYGYALFRAGHFDEAVAHWKRLIDLDPTNPGPYNQLARTYEAQGNETDAFEWLIKAMMVKKSPPETIQHFKTIYQTSGWRGVLLESARTPEARFAGDSKFSIATLYARAGEKDKAFELLEESFQQREWAFAGLFESPHLDSIRDDPRYLDLVRRIK